MPEPILPERLDSRLFHWDPNTVEIHDKVASVKVTWKERTYTIRVRGDFKDKSAAQAALKDKIDTAIILLARYASEDVKLMQYDEHMRLTRTFKDQSRFEHDKTETTKPINFDFVPALAKTRKILESRTLAGKQLEKTQDRFFRIEEAKNLYNELVSQGVSPKSGPFLVVKNASASSHTPSSLPETPSLTSTATPQRRGQSRLRAELEALKEEKAKLATQLEDTQNKHRELSEKVRAAQTKIAEQERALAELGRRFDAYRGVERGAVLMGQDSSKRRGSVQAAQATQENEQATLFQAENQRLLEQQQAMTRQLAERDDLAKQLSQQMDAKNRVVASLEQQIVDLQAEIRQLSTQQQPLKDSGDDSARERLSEYAEKLQEENKTLYARQAQLEQLLTQGQTAAEERDAALQALEQTSKELERVKAQKGKVSTNIKRPEDETRELDSLRNQLEKLQNVKEQLQRAKTTITQLNANLAKAKQLQDRLDEQAELILARETALARKQAEIKQLQQELSEAQTAAGQAQEASSNIAELLQRNERLRKEMHQMQLERQQLEESTKETMIAADAIRQQNEDFTAILTPLREFLATNPEIAQQFSEFTHRPTRSSSPS